MESTMKTDTEYFRLAVAAWCQKHKWDKDLPMTPAWLSEVLTDAQALKDVDKKKLEATA